MKPWWQKIDGLLEYELKQLDEAGITYQLDENAKKRGIIVLRNIRVTLPDGRVINGIKAVFPDLYPFFRFELFSDSLRLGHHQNPLNGALCLINRGTRNWRTEDTLAGLIRSQLHNVIKLGESHSKEEVADNEVHQAEPIASFIPYDPGHGIFIDSSWIAAAPDEIRDGIIEVGLERTQPFYRGAVLSLSDNKGNVIGTAPDYLINRYKIKMRCRWIRDNHFSVHQKSGAMLARVRAQSMDLTAPKFQQFNDVCLEITGVNFKDEYDWREKNWSGWVFILRVRPHSGNRTAPCKDMRPVAPGENSLFVKALHLNDQLMNARIPARQYLAKKTVAAIGLGCLGGQSAIEMAKAGIGELRIVDYDTVEPGTIVRWPLGLPAVGVPKTYAIANFITSHYPQTKVIPYPFRLGEVIEDPNQQIKPQGELIEELLNGVDLVYDASAETGIQYALSTFAKERGIAYISISTTHGCWGGLIFRIRPGVTKGCYYCLQAALKSGAIPSPATDPQGLVPPAGCDAPTYTGAAFDAGEVLMGGVRLAVSTLTANEQNGYPASNWDVAIVNLRTPDGTVIPPLWSTYPLAEHPDCPLCSSQKE